MSSRKIGNITFSNESGISMNFTKMSNMQLTPILGGDQASKYYVDSITAISSITNIGTGAQLYASRDASSVFLRTINRSINTNVTYDDTYVYTVPDLLYNPYGDLVDTTSLPFVSGTAYRYSTLGPDGMIYAMASTSIHIINPFTNTRDYTSLSFAGSGTSWHQPTLAPNGKMYFPPVNNTSAVLVVDTLNRTVDTTTYAKLNNIAAGSFIGSAIDAKGRIFFASNSYTSICIIDTNTGVMDPTTYSAVSSGTSRYASVSLGADGNIYFIPFDESKILIFDTSSNTLITTLTIPTASAPDKWNSSVLCPNGFIYCAPATDSRFIGINTYTRTVTVIGNLAVGFTKWLYGILAPDGKVYFRSNNQSRMLIFDPTTLVFDTTTLLLPYSSGFARGGTLGPNGKMYYFTTNGTTIIINTQSTPNQQPEFLYFVGNNH